MLPLALAVVGCYVGGFYLLLLAKRWWLPRRLTYSEGDASLLLIVVGYVLSLVLGVLFVRRVAQSATVSVALYVLLAYYAVVFPWFASMAANFAGQ